MNKLFLYFYSLLMLMIAFVVLINLSEIQKDVHMIATSSYK